MLVTYGTYTVVMKQELTGSLMNRISDSYSLVQFDTASKIFSSMAVELVLREQLSRVAGQYTLVIEGNYA